jgi:hypothetical protein
MGDFFGGLRSGNIQFPQVVMNQGPLPSSGGLPQPLHEQADARINYGTRLLGDLTPYAYGEPGYLSSQNAYLNIPHKIQKIVPVVYLPEAKCPARDIVDLSHPIDDGDIAFVLRLNRSSMFCTGLKNGSMRRAGLGTAIDPFINLCTLNYILSGMQLGVDNDGANLWVELLQNLNAARFGKQGPAGRDYAAEPINLNDIIHVVRHCIKPFGVTRGSEKQGGQDEATSSPATWPVSFVVSLTIDGKESNVLNIWHHHDMSAGEDLVLRLKLMPIRQYTLNHYYKGVKRQAWDKSTLPAMQGPNGMTHVWQLVPDLLTLEAPTVKENDEMRAILTRVPPPLRGIRSLPTANSPHSFQVLYTEGIIWQELGFWHIGRSQIMTGKYGAEEYWHNDLANSLRTNHLDITFQPMFQACTYSIHRGQDFMPRNLAAAPAVEPPRGWRPVLGLEQLGGQRLPPASSSHAAPDWLGRLEFADDVAAPIQAPPPPPIPPAPQTDAAEDAGPDWLGRLEFADDDPPAAAAVAADSEPQPAGGRKTGAGGRPAKRGRTVIGGSLLKADGTSEPSMVGML